MEMNKTSLETVIGKFLGGPNILMLSGHHWRSQRKVANPAFRRSMPVKLFGDLTQQLFKTMEETMSADGTVEVTELMFRSTLEAIGKAGFGKPSSCY
jgi:cytochrome P450